ncbi:MULTISPECIES: hypothetical protein [Chryseobacterium]|uniref:Uncharacterized protein n=2 Tax=Chryseobacterium gleum TaxID=250 RepID=A0A448B9J7_CHRGE|nr:MULTISPECIES: hypothetical protein [Chryseobacterium]HAF35330.1 hypothetical protein [Sphingobacterium sp.]EFK36051.1 hypothetical protein HMPREF0204_15120 [Chryseobacterium gleum ATCC 35910]QQY31753.1 hypothetical protein I6I60_23390 [Chryseobacterium gleum]VEE11227.1 Uncharacterised protein [Chryseobacterium gleum]VFA44023.1 Uncharacterised protein [Chryseobacterium indologenes]
MKSLQEMNNNERAFAVARLFPDQLGTLTNFIKTEIAHLREKEQDIRKAWPPNCIVTADYWYSLVQNAEQTIEKFGVLLYRNPRIFADHFFYQDNSVFGIHCMIRFAGSQVTPTMLRLAIELYFGDDKVVTIDFRKNETSN